MTARGDLYVALTDDQVLALMKALDSITSVHEVHFTIPEHEAFFDGRIRLRAIAQDIIHESRSARRSVPKL